MFIQNQTSETLTLVLTATQAQYLLAGLRERLDILGEDVRELVTELAAAGVTAAAAPDHIRTEYMPPLK